MFLKEALLEIFERDLNRLKNEISLYKDENELWVVKEEISNSAGNLCLHLVGNLNHFFGEVLGDTDYVRDRESEFTRKGVSREDLIAAVEKTADVVKNTLRNLPGAIFVRDFPGEPLGRKVKTDFMLVHLVGHFNYHLGQINYHRRLVHTI